MFKPLLLGAAAGDAPVEYTMQELRGMFTAMLANEGVCGANHLKVIPRAAGANLSVDFMPGWFAVDGDTQANERRYIAGCDVGENRPSPGAPGSGTRHHLVYAKVRASQSDGSGRYDWVIDYALDTGAGRPATPKTAIPLAQVDISAGQASIQAQHITDLRPFAKAISGTVEEYRGFKSGNTDGSAYIWLTHNLGRKPVGCVATFSHPAPASSSQATHVSVDMSTATTTQVRARVWFMQPYFVWVNKPVNISYILW